AEAGLWHTYRLPVHQLILIEAGKIEALTPTGRFVAGPGDLLCFRPTPRNEYGTLEAFVGYQVHLAFAPPPREKAALSLGAAGLLPEKISLGEEFAEAREAFEAICINLPRAGPVSLLRVRAAVLELLAVAAGTCMPSSVPLAVADPWERCRLRLEAGATEHVPTVAELARRLNLSTQHFIRCFRQRFGASPMQYHAISRLREAVRLLRDTEQPIKSIAYKLGFKHPRSFARALRRHLAVSPSGLRRGAPPAPLLAGVPEALELEYPTDYHILPPGANRDTAVVARYRPQVRRMW
ncbi:MAG TPA: AraC family transcriptional regulator, partial [Tepidisphaeraceae bacterium]